MKRGLFKDVKSVQLSNTQIQIQIHKYKYTNTVWVIFLKGNDKRTSKTMFPSLRCANTQIQLHKYTNTQIHKYTSKKQGRAVFKALWQGISSRIKHKTKLKCESARQHYFCLCLDQLGMFNHKELSYSCLKQRCIQSQKTTVLHPAKIAFFVRIKQANWESFAPFCVLQLYLCSYSNHNGPILHEKHPVLLLLHRHHLPFSALSRLFNGKLCQV